MKPILKLRNINKFYNKTQVLNDISFDIKQNDIISLLGPSGSGKSTILKIISGVVQPSSGSILYNDKNLLEIPIHQRNFGAVFQGYSLFPHLSVFDNIAFPLTTDSHKLSKSEIKNKVKAILKLLDLTGLETRKPKQLSGGQQQRVALGRAIIFNPDLLLLDEPLAALDAELKDQFLNEIKRIHDKFDITILYITHDQEEAMYISNKIIVINDGKIQQSGIPYDIYNYPKNEFLLNFFGESNFLYLKSDFASNNFLNNSFTCITTQNTIKAYIRPENIMISFKMPNDNCFYIKAKIESKKFLGNRWRYNVIVNDCIEWIIYQTSENKINVNQEIYLYWNKNKLLIF